MAEDKEVEDGVGFTPDEAVETGEEDQTLPTEEETEPVSSEDTPGDPPVDALEGDDDVLEKVMADPSEEDSDITEDTEGPISGSKEIPVESSMEMVRMKAAIRFVALHVMSQETYEDFRRLFPGIVEG